MNNILSALKEWGCDVNGAMERMLDDEEFYISCLNTLAEDDIFARLGDALKREDAAAGFDEAHCLKGLVANLGLTPMYKTVVLLVEPLRAGKTEGLTPAYEQLLKDYEKLQAILG